MQHENTSVDQTSTRSPSRLDHRALDQLAVLEPPGIAPSVRVPVLARDEFPVAVLPGVIVAVRPPATAPPVRLTVPYSFVSPW